MCRAEGCGGEVLQRDLCVRHYHALYRRVRKGDVSWAELVAVGACGEATSRNRQPDDFCEDALAKVRRLREKKTRKPDKFAAARRALARHGIGKD